MSFFRLVLASSVRYARASNAQEARAIFTRAFTFPEHGEPEAGLFSREQMNRARIEEVDALPDFADGYDKAVDTSAYVYKRTVKDRAHVSAKDQKVNAVRALNFLSLAH